MANSFEREPQRSIVDSSDPTLSSGDHQQSAAEAKSGWSFLTNHSHVLIALYRDPGLRQRDVAQLVGITEGAVQRILHDLEENGYVDVERVGRRNRYKVHTDLGLRHPLEENHTIGDLLDGLAPLPTDRAQ